MVFFYDDVIDKSSYEEHDPVERETDLMYTMVMEGAGAIPPVHAEDHTRKEYDVYCEGDIESNFDFSLEFVEDEIKEKGPISGIMTGLKNIKTDYALVLPCDSPFISEDNIDAMFKLLEENLESNIDAIIPFHIKSNKDKFKGNGEFNFNDASEMTTDMKIANSEPLHSIYKKENLNKIDELLKEDNLYVKSFIKCLKNPCFIEVDNKVLFEKDFRNFNRKEDLKDLEI